MMRIAFSLVVLVAVAASAFAQGGSKAPSATLVEVVEVTPREVTPKQVFVGTVMPIKKAVVGSAVDGRVIEFRVNEGDYVDLSVEDGNVLAVLLTETIGKELDAAKAELRLRQAELEEMQNGSRPEEIEQARARLEAAKARMEYTRLRLERLTTLYRQGRAAASSEEVDEATAAADEARSAYAEASAAYELAVQGPRPEQKAQAQARLAMQQAMVERLEDQIAKHTIRARFNGYVSAEHTEVGAWVNRGDPVAEIVALDQVDIEVHVVENHVPFIHVGDPTEVTLTALPEQAFPGSVVSIVPQADTRTRTFPVKVRVNNAKEGDTPILKAGMLARTMLPVGATQQGLAVPKDSLVLEGARKSVWVVDPKTVKKVDEGGATYYHGAAQKIPVTTGPEDEDWVLVHGDIKEGQFVITRGNERIFAPPVRWRATAPTAKETARAQ